MYVTPAIASSVRQLPRRFSTDCAAVYTKRDGPARKGTTRGISTGQGTAILNDSQQTRPHSPVKPEVRGEFNWELAAEAITVRIRWFGLCVGYALVNWLGPGVNQPELNGILTLGAVYALLDTWWSLRGRVFLGNAPLLIVLMEAIFIGLLCHFDGGLDSPFRFYYFLSLLVSAIRWSFRTTFLAFLLHALSATILALSHSSGLEESAGPLLLLLTLLGWVTWASTSLVGLIKLASYRLRSLNDELRENQALLEQRIRERTRELQESQALLVQQEKQAAFGLLAAGIAHEVGNPLAAISSLVQMLKRRLTDNYSVERLEMVDDQLARIQRTLRELVDFSRPATTEQTLLDVHEIIDASLNIAKYYKRKKGKHIITRFAPGIPHMRLVRDQLVQVFLNLILNAMDATEEGGRIEISTSLEDGWVRVDFRDTGHGIPADRAALIFQPYYTTKDTGTGLGLFVCRHLLERLDHGRIELTDTSESGSTFTVFLTGESVQDHEDIPPRPTTPEHTQPIASDV